MSVVVTVHDLRALRMSGSGDVSIDESTAIASNASSSGSGDMSVDEIKVERLKLSASGSGDIAIDKARPAHSKRR